MRRRYSVRGGERERAGGGADIIRVECRAA